MKIVIVMTYFNRQFQLDRTLESFKSKHKDFEVVIVDDCSTEPPVIGLYDFPITVRKTENKRWIDGSPAYNIGIKEALKRADIIILQNAETYHYGDVISRAAQVTENNYISFACYNLSKEWTFRDHDLSWIITHYNNHAVDNENNAWLNHKYIRPTGYHWCSAITANNMRKLNGFDESFSDGYCFEDDELLARVKMLNLTVEITDTPFVVHQWHDRDYVPRDWTHLYEVNRNLLDQIKLKNKYKAVHTFTDDFNN